MRVSRFVSSTTLVVFGICKGEQFIKLLIISSSFKVADMTVEIMACRSLAVESNQALVFLISRVWVQVTVLKPVSLSMTLNHDASSFGHHIGHVCCVTHV